MNRRNRKDAAETMALHLAGGTAADLQRLRRAHGRGARCWERQEDELVAAGLSATRARRLVTLDPARLRAEPVACHALGLRLVQNGSSDYPDELDHLVDPPLILAVRGRWPPPAEALAIVGARAATSYGRSTTGRLARAAAGAGVAVISGLARGVDRWALEATLDVGGWPLAVLGNGPDVVYPPEHAGLQAAIAERGTVISEFPLGHRPSRWSFPRRNRIIAALARWILVVEAGRRSGALITVDHGLDLGREILAVPGPVDAPPSEGTNRLILDGAVPVLDEAVLLQTLDRDLPARGDPSSDPIIDAIGHNARTADELALACGVSTRAVRSRLIALELDGRVDRLPGDRYLRRA